MHDYDYIYRSFVKGDVTPFYEDLYPGLLVYASRQLGPDLSYLAEDCVQDAVMSSYTERKRLRTSMAWYAYILKCIYHSAIGLVRKHNSRNNYLESHENEHVTTVATARQVACSHRVTAGEVQDTVKNELSGGIEKCRDCTPARRGRNHGEKAEGPDADDA